MTIFKDYPYWSAETLEDIKTQLRQICSLRKDDISQINNLTNTFIGGRKVNKIQSSSTDIIATDKLNDINWDASFIYILIDDSGTPEWRRATLASW